MRSIPCLSMFLLCLSAVLVLGGCGTGTSVAANPAPTVTLSANPTSAAQNGSSTLLWSSTNAKTVSIDQGVGAVAVSGSVTVKPAQTTTYTITATGAGGSTTASTTVKVSTPTPTPTVTITASPAAIAPGATSTLTVTATNATSVVISNNVNSTTYTLPVAGGTQIVTPTQTAIYTATTTGTSGSTTASVTVTVSANPPTVTITASPTAVTSGGTSTIAVTATNATSVVISNNLNSTTYTLPVAGGTQVVTPTQTTTYTATATGAGGSVTASATITFTAAAPTVTIAASPAAVGSGGTSTLTVVATNATNTVISNSVDSTSYTLAATGGTQIVMPTKTTMYTATATGTGGTVTAATTVTVSSGGGSVQSVNHVLFMMQENRSFDSYFGMLNPYRQKNGLNVADDGNTYNVDGTDDKLATTCNVNNEGIKHCLFHTISTCLDDMTSAWMESYGSVNQDDFSLNRSILDNGFVHVAESYALSGSGSGTFTGDKTGERAMAYYQDTSVSGKPELNYYYYMASQFALSDRWFSPVSSKTKPNRLATMAGGTTQGLVRDPGADDDDLPQRNIKTIFEQLQDNNVSWKIYYTTTTGLCNESFDPDTCGSTINPNYYPTTTFEYFSYSNRFLYSNPSGATCTGTTIGSQAAGVDPENDFCIDINHIAPVSQLLLDIKNGTLPEFAYIEPGYGINDEHPGSGQSILTGQIQVSKILNTLMSSVSWKDSIFFLARDISGGPYDHVPPVAGHSNDNTNMANMGYLGNLPGGAIPDISTIAVNADSYKPCLLSGGDPLHCDLKTSDPGAHPTDAPAIEGFAAQLGFRIPNLVVSPFTRKHYVSHVPMDHTAVLKFVQNRFIGASAHMTARDEAQPDLLDFFDFANVPWQTPPAATILPTPPVIGSTCTPSVMK
jgi:phospholipase C